MRFSSMLRRREWDFDQVPASLKHGGVGWERWRLFCIDEKREIIEGELLRVTLEFVGI